MTEPSRLPFHRDLFLVTGGSSGLGRAVALDLAARGARILVNGRDPGRLQETLALLPGTGHAAVPAALDGMDQACSLVERLVLEHGPIRGLVHSAGVHSVVPLSRLKEAHVAEVLAVNVQAALGLLKGFRQRNSHGPGASLVFITSVMGQVGAPSRAAYCAAKGAIEALARAAALELARDGVRVNCVAPGYVETDMLARLREQLTDDQFEAVRASHPLGFGTPGDVAEAVAFLLGTGARWITGVTLVVDGGYSAH